MACQGAILPTLKLTKRSQSEPTRTCTNSCQQDPPASPSYSTSESAESCHFLDRSPQPFGKPGGVRRYAVSSFNREGTETRKGVLRPGDGGASAIGPCAQKGPLCPSRRQGIRRAGTGSSCSAQHTLPPQTQETIAPFHGPHVTDNPGPQIVRPHLFS